MKILFIGDLGGLQKTVCKLFRGTFVDANTTILERARLAQTHDVVQTTGKGIMYAWTLGKPFVVWSGGSDLRVEAKRHDVTGWLYRHGLKQANAIVYSNPDQRKVLAELNLLEKSVFIPQPVDLSFWKPKKVKRADNKLVTFWPTKQDYARKNNLEFVKKYALMSNAETERATELRVVKWGNDFQTTMDELAKLGLSTQVKVLPYLSVRELRNEMRACDFVADQFSSGSMGLIALWALALEKPLFTVIDADAHYQTYGELPPLSGGKPARKFVKKHHDLKRVKRLFQKVYSKLSNR